MAHEGEQRRKAVLVPMANGSEEIESVCIIDTLRRAGAEVTGAWHHRVCVHAMWDVRGSVLTLTAVAVASVETTHELTCSRGTKIVADCLIDECTHTAYDLIALPGTS